MQPTKPTSVLLTLVAIALSYPALAFEQAGVAGSWSLTAEQADGTTTESDLDLSVDGDVLTGHFTDSNGTTELTGSVDGEQIRFEFSGTTDGYPWTVTVTGMLEGEMLKGKWEAAAAPGGTWSATRK